VLFRAQLRRHEMDFSRFSLAGGGGVLGQFNSRVRCCAFRCRWLQKPDMRCRLFASIGSFETYLVEWGGGCEGGEAFPLRRVRLESRHFLNLPTK
jgi:hypothetical protein